MTAQVLQDVSRAALRLAASYPDNDLGNPKDPLDDLIYIILSGQRKSKGTHLFSGFPEPMPASPRPMAS